MLAIEIYWFVINKYELTLPVIIGRLWQGICYHNIVQYYQAKHFFYNLSSFLKLSELKLCLKSLTQ